MSASAKGRAGAALLLALAAAAGCETGPKETVQGGFRGTGMEQVYDRSRLEQAVAATQLPPKQPPLPPGRPAGPNVWKNVQVLQDISPAELTRTMVAVTQWVSPKEGCNYCHVPNNFASDSIYTKIVSRRMFQMVRDINEQWGGHVGQTGVTCWTCHRGNPVPRNVWYFTDRNQPLRHYLDREDVRVQSASWAPSNANRTSIKQAEYTYSLMIDMSRSLGVNCTYCHNSPRWGSWEQSTPQRITALRGIRMARALNNDYLLPLQPVFPASRLGPHGDVPKIQCSTCHGGAYKPLYGARMAQDYPAMYWHRDALTPAPPTAADTGATPGVAAPVAPGTRAMPVPAPAPATSSQQPQQQGSSRGSSRPPPSVVALASPHVPRP